MRHEKLVVERVKRGIKGLFDTRKIKLAILHGRMVAMHEHGSGGNNKKKSNVFAGQLDSPAPEAS
jgi:hypothetical protein